MITVNSNQCGGTWRVAKPGWHTLEINNQGTGGGDIDLVNPVNGAVYAEVENSGPGTITPMSLDVGSGKYALLCSFGDYNPRRGHGHRAGARGRHPGDHADHRQRDHPAGQEVPGRGRGGLKVIAPETATLAAAVRSGNLAAAGVTG